MVAFARTLYKKKQLPRSEGEGWGQISKPNLDPYDNVEIREEVLTVVIYLVSEGILYLTPPLNHISWQESLAFYAKRKKKQKNKIKSQTTLFQKIRHNKVYIVSKQQNQCCEL